MPAKINLPMAPIFGVVAALILGAGGWLVIRQANQARASIPVLGQVPTFEFVKQDGSQFGLNQIKGKLNVIDFIFTSCPDQCPLMTAKMAELYRSFKGSEKVRFVSITVDAARDSLSVLRQYAHNFGVDDDRWVFLWAPLDDVVKLSEKGFMLSARNLPEGHSNRFVLVDQDGLIRGYYDGTDDASLKVMITSIRELAKAM
jgi:protein SCO1/2